MPPKPVIMCVNDDGVDADGLRCVARGLAAFARVIVVAPDANKSACSAAMSLGARLQVERREPEPGAPDDMLVFSVSGTPVDCVVVGLKRLVPQYMGVDAPDLVVSGMNHGANLGADCWVSGTVSAAMQAAKDHVLAIACSLCNTENINYEANKELTREQFEQATAVVVAMAQTLLEPAHRASLGSNMYFNINVPERAAGSTSYAVTRLSSVNWGGDVARELPRDAALGDRADAVHVFKHGGEPQFGGLAGSDAEAVNAFCCAITPMSVTRRGDRALPALAPPLDEELMCMSAEGVAWMWAHPLPGYTPHPELGVQVIPSASAADVLVARRRGGRGGRVVAVAAAAAAVVVAWVVLRSRR